jgi:hypothetical protein
MPCVDSFISTATEQAAAQGWGRSALTATVLRRVMSEAVSEMRGMASCGLPLPHLAQP